MKFSQMPYNRIDKNKITKEFEELQQKFLEAQSGDLQFQVHEEYYQLTNKIITAMELAQIRHDIDTEEKFYKEEQEYYDETAPIIHNLEIEYQKHLYQSKYRSEIENRIGQVAFKNMELKFKSFDEKLIPLMQEENSLVSAYNNLIAGAKIEWDDKILNLSLLGPYLTNNDREIRKRAWKKYSEFFERNAEELDQIFDKLVKNRTAQAKEMGFENFLELGYNRMNRNCYRKEELEKFRAQIKKDFVPFAESLHERRRKRLQIDHLMSYDEGVYFINGNPDPIGTPDEIMQNGQKMYSELSDQTKEFFDFMMKNELFDVLGRKTKKAGGYMTYLPEYSAPFIFANFNGTSGDIDVITHECGHAFQGFLSGKDPIREHSDITMDLAEIHSMSMEFFTEPWMKLFFGERTEDYLAMHLEDAAAFIPYGCMVDEFQHIIYEKPELTPAERHEVWKKLEQEYKPHLDYGDDAFFSNGRFWQKQLHIYSYPFYYIDYVLAQTCAFQYKVKMDTNYETAWKSYLSLCELSAKEFFTESILKVGLEDPFKEGCIKNIVSKLEEKLN